MAALSLALTACGSKVEGTYSNANGLAMLELRSGGKATTTMMGDTHDCTYTVEGKQINVDCNGDKSAFRLNDDGSLTGPGFIGVMRKAK
jgi:hypothetical protein